MSQVTTVEQELKTEDSELIKAARNPATTRPRSPGGNSSRISVGSAASGSLSSIRPVCVRGYPKTFSREFRIRLYVKTHGRTIELACGTDSCISSEPQGRSAPG